MAATSSPQSEYQLPLSQDQKLCLTQALSKLLLLRGILECVRLCVHSLKMESVSYGLHALLSISPTGFQSQLFWGTRLPRVGPLGLGSLMWALNMGFSPCYMGRTSAVIIVPPFGDHPPRSMSLDYTVLLPLIFASLFFLFASLIVEDLCY